MDNDLALLLEQPFIARHTDGAGVMGNSERLQKKANKNESVAVMLRMGNEIQAHNQFRNSLKEALKPHLLLANLLQQSFFSPDVPPAAQKALEDKGSGFHNHITDIIKQFKIYIETASDEILEKEAQRLERRYFQNTGSQNQIEFIKFRRYYEKLKTFNEAAKKHWREIQKHLDTFALVTETADIVNTVSRHDIQNLTRLMRQTDSYLESLKGYLRIEKDEYDNITHSYRIELAYESSLNYSRAAFFGESQEEEEKGSDESEESQEEREGEAGAPEEFEGSIARNIILETKEHRLNSASTLSVPILGSRDWNRTPHYRMEVPVRDYNSCLVKFKISHMVVIDQKSVQTHMTTAAALVRKGTGAKVLPQYIKLIQEALDTISVDIIMKDYPGLANPLVFFILLRTEGVLQYPSCHVPAEKHRRDILPR